MIHHKSRIHHTVTDREGVVAVADMTFEDCDFFNCSLWAAPSPEHRSSVSHVSLVKCRTQACRLGPILLSDIHLKDVSASDLLIMWGTLFRRVKLEGRIASLKLNTQVETIPTSKRQAAFDAHRKAFYAGVDWALDISRARLRVFEMNGVPAHLIRRDPETQVVVLRERLRHIDWRRHVPDDNYWEAWLAAIEKGDEAGFVLAAQLGSNTAYRKKTLADLSLLREIGLTEDD